MMFLKQVSTLLQNELKLEWRGKAAINSILLYVVSITYILHVSFKNIDANLWNAMFWIVITFSSVNAITKSFVGDSEGKKVYYYSLVSPEAYYVSKIVYNFFLLLSLALLTRFALILFLPTIEIKSDLFWITIILGSAGYSFVMTLISAIASKAKSGNSLMAILSFPVIIPMLMFLLELSINAILGKSISDGMQDILVLTGLNILIFSTGFVLFPYLWRD